MLSEDQVKKFIKDWFSENNDDGTLFGLCRAVAEAAVNAEREGKEPVAWRVEFATPVGLDSLIVSRRKDAEKQVRRELILSVEPLYKTPPAAPVPEAMVLLRCALNGFLVTQKLSDYGDVHWSNQANKLLAATKTLDTRNPS